MVRYIHKEGNIITDFNTIRDLITELIILYDTNIDCISKALKNCIN